MKWNVKQESFHFLWEERTPSPQTFLSFDFYWYSDLLFQMTEVLRVFSFCIKYSPYSNTEPGHIYNVFMLLLCLQGALLRSIWTVMKLVCGAELVLKKWSLICIKLDLKENLYTSSKADSCGWHFPQHVLHLSVPFPAQALWGSGSPVLCISFFHPCLPLLITPEKLFRY